MRLQRLSREKGLTSGEVARTLGVSDSLVRRWHRGSREPTLSNLVDYAALLGTSVPALIGDAETRLPEELIAVLVRMSPEGLAIFYDFAAHWMGHHDRVEARAAEAAEVDRSARDDEPDPRERGQALPLVAVA